MAVLGLRFCARAFSSCGKRGPHFIAVRGPLTIAASPVGEHRLQTRRLSNCGSRAQLLCGMWDPPRPGLEPVSPASAGRLSTTAPPGKPQVVYLLYLSSIFSELHFINFYQFVVTLLYFIIIFPWYLIRSTIVFMETNSFILQWSPHSWDLLKSPSVWPYNTGAYICKDC